MDLTNEQELRQVLQNWPSLFQKYAQPNARKAILQIFTSFLPFVALWVLMYFSLSYSYWLTFGLAIINAFFLVRIFIIQHDCGHRSFFKSQKLNKTMGIACSLFTTIPFKYWARVHDFHHGHSGQLEVSDIGDIHTMTVEEYKKADFKKRLKYRLFRMPFVTFIIGPVYYIAVNNRFPMVNFKGWQKTHKALHINNLLLALVYVGLGFLIGWKEFLLIQLTIVALFSIIAVWFFYVQHQHEDTYKQWKDNWDFLLAAVKGSTYYKLPRLFQWLTGNIGFHHIHHLNSKIPNYNLEWCQTEHPYLEKYITKVTFFESLGCMFNKLWDEEQQKMITFREYRLLYSKAA